MPYYFGQRSREKLQDVDEELVEVLYDAIEISPYDFMILQGHRTAEEQDRLYAIGRTTPGDIITWVRGGFSRHNSIPAEAVDIVPYPVNWDDHWRFGFICGLLYSAGKARGIELEFLPDKGDYGHVQKKR